MVGPLVVLDRYAKYYFALRAMSERKNFRRRYMLAMKVHAPGSKRIAVRAGVRVASLRPHTRIVYSHHLEHFKRSCIPRVYEAYSVRVREAASGS